MIMELELRIKNLLIKALELEDIGVEDIDDNEALFGEGLGLDSIDALELGIALKKEFHLVLGKDKEKNKKIFYSVKSIADFIRSQQDG